MRWGVTDRGLICGACIVDGPESTRFVGGTFSDDTVEALASGLHCFCCKRNLHTSSGDTVTMRKVEIPLEDDLEWCWWV